MRKDEFLKMIYEDIVTEKELQKSLYMDVIDCMEIALSQSPASFDVPADKTVQGAYKVIEHCAMKNRKGNVACVRPSEVAEAIAEYLGTKYVRASKRLATSTVKIEDFI